jgi:hypothetical protein
MPPKFYDSSNIPLPDWTKLKFKAGNLVKYKPNGELAVVREYATGYKYPYAIWFLDKKLVWTVADESELEKATMPTPEPVTKPRKKRTKNASTGNGKATDKTVAQPKRRRKA